MSKYRELAEYLASIDESEWNASFEEIEQILGGSLPESARLYPAWWANQKRAQSWGWQSAGWKASAVDLANERVKFIYVGDREDRYDPDMPAPAQLATQPLTFAEAKAGVALNYRVPADAIEITIKG